MPLVYEQLRVLASRYMQGERQDHTLRATALLHEPYVKLAAGEERLTLDEGLVMAPQTSGALEALDEALTRLEASDKRKCQVVEMLYFGGLTYEETPAALGVSDVTVHRDLKIANAGLVAERWMRRCVASPGERTQTTMITNDTPLPGPPVPVPTTNVAMRSFGGHDPRITTAVQQALRDVDTTKNDPPVIKLTPMKAPSLMDVVKWQTQQKQLDRKVVESITKPKEKELAGKVADVDKVLARAPAITAVDDPRCKFVSRLGALAAVKDNKQREAIAEPTYKQEIAKPGAVEEEPLRLATAALQLPPAAPPPPPRALATSTAAASATTLA